MTLKIASFKPLLALTVAVAAALPSLAMAHRSWLLPAATVLSGKDSWVTVDAAVSNDLFYFEHNAARLDNLTVTGPDGSAVKPQNQSQGKHRSVFDLQLTQAGTYRIALVNSGVSASYKVNGEVKRWRGTEEALAKEVPANAAELTVTRNMSRNETFVTAGKPSVDNLKPSGVGLELVPVTHPNDLFAGESATFRFVLDGKPAANVEVLIIPGGIRYRNQLNEIKVTTDEQGQISVKWPTPGYYWLSASVGGGRQGGAPAMGGVPSGGPAAGGSTAAQPAPSPAAAGSPAQRRASYVATLEVLPQ